MDFTLSKKHEMARTLFKEFAENEVKPLAQETDENEQFPVETVEKMAKYGFLGIPVPKEYGGLDVSAQTAGLALLGPFDLILIGATIADYLRDRKFNSGKQKQGN